MDLLPVILSIAQAEGPAAVLGQIINAVMENEHVALARIWFLDQEKACPVCGRQGDEVALHMRASGGRPLEAGADWTRIDRSQHHVALDSKKKLAAMVRSGEPLLVTDVLQDAAIDQAWARRERIQGVVGHPLRFRGNIVGVTAVFLRVHPNRSTLDWLEQFSAHAAVAIGNSRAFQEIDQLRRQLELERDYLREEVVQTGEFQE